MIIYSLCQLATKVSSIDPVKGFDPLGTAGVITNGSASVVSSNLYDVFGVLRYTQGSAQTPWRWKQRPSEDEGIIRASGKDLIPEVAVSLQAGADDLQKCLEACKRNHEMCKMLADAHYEVDKANCGAVKAVCLAACLLVPPAKRGDCTQACNAAEAVCLAAAQNKHAKALLECVQAYQKCVENCTKNPSQPPEVKQPTLPNMQPYR